MRIQLLTFPGCPNAQATRAMLERAIAATGLAVAVEEVDTSSPLTPAALRGWGSPTVLVDGRDAAGEIAPLGSGCRLYRQEDGELKGAPPASMLARALRRAILATAG